MMNRPVLPSEVPFSVGWNNRRLQEQLARDSDPVQLVAAIGPGPGNAGHYSEQALEQLVREVVSKTVNGHLGHQDPATLSTRFPDVVIRWIGARWDGSRALIRGFVDRHASQVKEWLRSGAITQPSIYTEPLSKSAVARK